tara:strand:+ start:303 stop:518 length:216 start_codon:yes stop_codon:yes gene_type:complete
MITEIFDILSQGLDAEVYIENNYVVILTNEDRLTVHHDQCSWSPWLVFHHAKNDGFYFSSPSDVLEYLKTR